MRGSVTREPFGRTRDGQPVAAFLLRNAQGMELRALTYGGIIASLRVPDRLGRSEDVVLGHRDLEGYLTASPYFGAIVGRYANRIAGGRFTLDGRDHVLATNDGRHHLHGGPRGFDKVVWSAASFQSGSHAGVAFSYTSEDGEEGYPGSLRAQVTCSLSDGNEVVFEYSATTDAPTHVNLSQHTYFNLAGEGTGNILGHRLTVHADRYTPVDAELIPTGALAEVAGTRFDFREPAALGARLGEGYDHNFVLNGSGSGLRHAARLEDPHSGRRLDIHTTEPGLQLYTGNFLDGTIEGKSGRPYARHAGVCLETQHFPDSPHRPGFPTTVLRPGEVYRSTTVWAFGVEA
jgi:aldose 1-epimerase